MTPQRCRSCGREIVWAETNHGKKVPLDAKGLVFSVLPAPHGLTAVLAEPRVMGERLMISHFATCPQANQWSGQHRETAPASQTPFTMAPERHFSEPKEVS